MDVLDYSINLLKGETLQKTIAEVNSAYRDTQLPDICSLLNFEKQFIEEVHYVVNPVISKMSPIIMHLFGGVESDTSQLVFTTTPKGINYMIVDTISQSPIESEQNIRIGEINQIIDHYIAEHTSLPH